MTVKIFKKLKKFIINSEEKIRNFYHEIRGKVKKLDPTPDRASFL